MVCGDRDAAADATQEAFKRAYVRWARLRREPWVGGWVMTTAMNLCKRELKQRLRPNPLAQPEAPPREAATADRVDVLAALHMLPFRQRQATVLFYWADLPTPAIAQLMGLSEGAVRAHLAHARTTLRKTLEVADA